MDVLYDIPLICDSPCIISGTLLVKVTNIRAVSSGIPYLTHVDPGGSAVYGHSFAGTAGSNPTVGMDVCLL